MDREANVRRQSGALTERQAERMLAGMNDVIRAGEEMRKLRAEMIGLFVGFGWTQDRIARLTDMSQPAVSKQVARCRSGEPPAPTPMDLTLDQYDAPWLEGRLWGLAEEIAEACDTARCTRYVHAIARGRKRLTPRNVDELRRLLEEDLASHRLEFPTAYRDAYDRISRGLDLPSKAASPAPAALRRVLACHVQRDHFRDDRGDRGDRDDRDDRGDRDDGDDGAGRDGT
ncbi:sigma-70 family RNA polymerase sigma factor [Streptomyces sp. CB00455]|uniref:sigma-70 family RNA polymerase sigma factor n=1 Tax=Streptomyces sp. CB00455 TaxID=1703927 RepID=UPI001F5B8DB4|nr:sigma-70 family RNA polymerase sigma factor [Streptomyces sp. CB00455]